MDVRKLIKQPLFILGLIIKVFLLITFKPSLISNQFLPFLEMALNRPSIDPWGSWITSGGLINAFPFGTSMCVSFMPLMFIAKLMNLPTILGYNANLLLFDFILLLLLIKLSETEKKIEKVLLFFWLSPIALILVYVFGFNDIIPITLFTLSLFLLKNGKAQSSAFILVASISSKLNILLSLPFFFIYLINNPSKRILLKKFILGFSAGTIIFLYPHLDSPAAFSMLVNNIEINKVISLNIPLNNASKIYVIPMLYILILYIFWRMKKLNFELFYFTLGLVFLSVTLLSLDSPNWYYWLIPMFIAYQLKDKISNILIVQIFTMFFLLKVISSRPLELSNGNIFFFNELLNRNFDYSLSFLHLIETVIFAVGLILAAKMYRDAIESNVYFKITKKPIVIGIAGNSGAGKDTLSNSITKIFGKLSVSEISGDNYHNWDRKEPMWKIVTHLNPSANNLFKFNDDLIKISHGKTIINKKYDHKTGKASDKFLIKSNDIIIANGLHALRLSSAMNIYDLKIFIDTDDKLRKFFKMKRDISERNYTSTMLKEVEKRRNLDYKKFIAPQAFHADLIFRIYSIKKFPNTYLRTNSPVPIKLTAIFNQGSNEENIKNVLTSLCDIDVSIITNEENNKVSLTMQGEVSSLDISRAAKILFPNITEIFDEKPEWQSNSRGLMQLIIINYINQILFKRDLL